MKKIFTIIALVALSLTAFAQQKKVAVYVAGEQNDISQALANQLVEAFAKSGKYIAIERTGSFLAELGKEQSYQRTGAVDDNELSRLGKQFGVQLVCVAKIGDVFGQKNISARLIDVESAEVANSSNAYSKLESLEEFMTVVDKITKELTSETMQEKAAFEVKKQEVRKLINDAFERGYLQIGNLYISTALIRTSWEQVPSIISSCSIGGWSDWRIPTCAEMANIHRELSAKHIGDINLYSYLHYTEIEFQRIERLTTQGRVTARSYWIINGDYYTSESCRPVTSIREHDLMLVRDIK